MWAERPNSRPLIAATKVATILEFQLYLQPLRHRVSRKNAPFKKEQFRLSDSAVFIRRYLNEKIQSPQEQDLPLV
jgi:hypothetical protein